MDTEGVQVTLFVVGLIWGAGLAVFLVLKFAETILTWWEGRR